MTLDSIKAQVREYYYMEDDAIIDVALATIIANRLKLGDPIWLVIIGASSGGKSQIIRPLSMTDKKYIHRVDDITENTFLSGGVAAGGKDLSLLKKIGKEGMITISDMTVLFSRGIESRNAILSQFRMLYDGEMIKHVGNKPEPLEWSGYLGIIAGSTPSIYAHLEDVSDMGERFMYYRMKPYDERKATRLALSRKLYGKQLDEHLSEIYGAYIQEVVRSAVGVDVELLPEQVEEIIEISDLAEKIRTVNKIDKFSKEVERIPTPAMPMRTALQLMNIAKALRYMRGRDLDKDDMQILTWLGLSLGNEEKREVLKVLAYSDVLTTATIADSVGLDTRVIRTVLQNLASTKIVTRTGENSSLKWEITDTSTRDILTGVFKKTDAIVLDREEVSEENEEVF